jgi:hypothetical protein
MTREIYPEVTAALLHKCRQLAPDIFEAFSVQRTGLRTPALHRPR